MAWGNLTGIRVDGYLHEFSTGLCVVQPDWTGVTRTDKERQTSTYTRTGKIESVKSQLRPARELRRLGADWTMLASEVIEDTGPGTAKVDVEFTSPKEAKIAGAYYCLSLPASVYSAGTVQLIDPKPPAFSTVLSLLPGVAEQNEYLREVASGVRFLGSKHRLEVSFAQPAEVIIRDDRREGSYDLQVYVSVLTGETAAGQSARNTFTLRTAGDLDKSPVVITMDAARPGQAFDGLGGNFRIQNPKADPPIIAYNLETLRVAWSRVELPWSLWDPDESSDPLEAARAGRVHPRVHEAMEMARRLAQKRIPVIVSAWSAPDWAILGDPRAAFRQDDDGPRGNPLNPAKMDRIRVSLAGYLIHLKEKYGVEAAMFSFNESDLGINVRQTPREHALLIRTLGPDLAARGLATKLVLGDTSDANPVDFIKMALEDPDAVKYVGAVAFHSWRGCTDAILAQWHDAARRLNVPLLVAEGSTDAAAWRYPQILLEQSFALYEINLYTRILAIAQPKSILQWQLTSDYSIVAGGGAFGDNGPVRPTQRYWNLRQLASTPQGAFALPVKSDRAGITCAAFGDIANGAYAVHIVNNGGSRGATLKGLPAGVKSLRVRVTDSRRGMQEGDRIPVVDGQAQITLDAMSFTTLMSD